MASLNSGSGEDAAETLRLGNEMYTRGNYDAAYRWYKSGIDKLMVEMRNTRNERHRDALRQRIEEYMNRNEEIKQMLHKSRNKPPNERPPPPPQATKRQQRKKRSKVSVHGIAAVSKMLQNDNNNNNENGNEMVQEMKQEMKQENESNNNEMVYNVILKYPLTDETWEKMLHGNNWNEHFQMLFQFVGKKTKLSTFHLIINNNCVDSAKSLENELSIVDNIANSNVINVVARIKEGYAASKDHNQCIVIYNCDLNRKEYFQFCRNESNFDEIFFKFSNFIFECFKNVLKEKKNMEIYYIENVNNLESNHNKIESGSDFEKIFQVSKKMNYISPGGNDPNYMIPFVFNIKNNEDSEGWEMVENDKYFVIVDLRESDVDCKESLKMALPRHDLKEDGLWLESMELLEAKIGEKMKEPEWRDTNKLIDSTYGKKIRKLEDFIDVFARYDKLNDSTVGVNFFVQAGREFVPDWAKLFIIGLKENNVSWKPEFDKESEKAWKDLTEAIGSHLEKDSELWNDGVIKYNELASRKRGTSEDEKNENLNKIDISRFGIDNDVLNEDTISSYMNLLKSSKTTRIMYFHMEMKQEEKNDSAAVNSANESNESKEEKKNESNNQREKPQNENEHNEEKQGNSDNSDNDEAQDPIIIFKKGDEKQNELAGDEPECVVQVIGGRVEETEVDMDMVLKEAQLIDNRLLNMESITNNIECDLEYLYDQIRDRDALTHYVSKNNKNMENDLQLLKMDENVVSSIFERIERLLQLMSDEGYTDSNVTVVNLKEIQKEEKSVNGINLNGLRKCLKNTMDDIRPFDIKTTIDLFKKTEKAGKELTDKDVVLVIGHTGAGKSTTIHFLSGSEMSENKSTGHIEPINVTNEWLKEIKTEFTVAESVTRFVSTVPIDLKESGVTFKISDRNAKKQIMLCDTPGFDDSAGPEVDTANGLGIVRAIKEAKSVKILLLIGIGDLEIRFKGVKALSHTLAKLLPTFDEHFESIHIIFTKVNGRTEEQILNIFQTAYKELETSPQGDDKDTCYVKLLEHIIELESLILLNPIKDDRTKVLNMLFGPKQSKKWIDWPGTQFEPFVTRSSKERITQQILRHESNINYALTKNQYNVIMTKLTEMKELNEILPQTETQESITKCMNKIVENWNGKCNKAMNDLTKYARETHVSMNDFAQSVANYKYLLLNEAIECGKFQSSQLLECQDGMIEVQLLENTLFNVFSNDIISKCKIDNSKECEINFDKALCMLDIFKDDAKYESNLRLLYNQRLKEIGNEIASLAKQTKFLIDQSLITPQNRDENVKHCISQKNANGGVADAAEASLLPVGHTVGLDSIVNDNDNDDFDDSVENDEYGPGSERENLPSLSSVSSEVNWNDVNLFNQICDNLALLGSLSHLTAISPRNDSDIGIDFNGISNEMENYLIRKLSQDIVLSIEDMFKIGQSFDIIGDQAMKRCQFKLKTLNDANKAFEITKDGIRRQLQQQIHNYQIECEARIVQYFKHSSEFVIKNVLESKETMGNNDESHTSSVVDSGAQGRRDARVFLMQMTMIRKLNENIQLKTSDVYYHTIEKLIGFLQEIQRTFNHLIDQIENDRLSKINYDDLVDCVIILRECSWIFALRDGVDIDYSKFGMLSSVASGRSFVYHNHNQNNDKNELYLDQYNEMLDMVEQKLEGYIETLWRDANGLYIELSEPKCIDQSRRIMESLNKMNALQRLLPNIMDSINKVALEIETQFREKLNEIIDTYNDSNANDNRNENNKQQEKPQNENSSEEKKEDEKENERESIENKYLNTRNASDSLAFIEECKTISWIDVSLSAPAGAAASERAPIVPIKNSIGKAEKNIVKYIFEYGSYVSKQLENSFNYLINIESKNAGKNAIKNGCMLGNRLGELTKMENQWPKVYSKLTGDSNDGILSKWPRKFSEQFYEIDLLLEKYSGLNDPRLQIAMIHVRGLMKVDFFLREYANFHGTLFWDLYKKYQNKANPDHKELFEAIEKENWIDVGMRLDRLSQNVQIARNVSKDNGSHMGLESAYNTAIDALGRKLVEKSESCRLEVIKLSGNFYTDNVDFQGIGSLFKTLKNASNYCHKYLSENDKIQIAKNEKRSLKSIEAMQMAMKNKAEANISANSFKQAEIWINKIQRMKDTLGTTLNSNGNSNKNENENETEDDGSLGMETLLDNRLKQIEKMFLNDLNFDKDQSINPYTGFATNPKRLYQRLEDVMSDHAKYRTLWVTIEADIRKKFLKTINDTQRFFAYDESVKRLKFLRAILKSLPNDMANELSLQLDNCENELSTKRANEYIERCIEDSQWVRLRETYLQYTRSRDTENANMIKTSVKTKLTDLDDQMKQELLKTVNELKVEKIFEILDSVNRIYLEFAVLNNRVIVPEFESIYHRMIDCVENKFEYCINGIVKIISVSNNSEVQNLDVYSKFASEFAIQDRKRTTASYFTVKVDKLTKHARKYVIRFFSNQTKMFESALTEMNISLLNAILNEMKLYSRDGTKFWEYFCSIDVQFDVKAIDAKSGKRLMLVYEDMIGLLLNKLDELKNYMIKCKFSSDERTKFHKERKEFYDELAHNLNIFKECQTILRPNHFHGTTDSADGVSNSHDFIQEYYDPCIKSIHGNINQLQDSITIILEKSEKVPQLLFDFDILDEANKNFSNLKSIEESTLLNELDALDGEKIRKSILTTEKNITFKIKAIGNLAMDNVKNLDKFVRYLIGLSMGCNTLVYFQDKISRVITECLNKYARENPSQIQQLAFLLEKDDSKGAFGSVLTSEHALFKGVNLAKFNKATHEQNIDVVLKNIKCNDNSINSKLLKQQFEQFDKSYNQLLNLHLKKKDDLNLDPLIDNIEQIARDCRNVMIASPSKVWKAGAWNNEFKKTAIDLMAYVFAIWTLQNSQYYFENKQNGSDENRAFLKQPRVAQVVTILRLLSVDDVHNKLLMPHLGEVGTGEGKSLTIAVTACVLALLGFDISCACYSEYLSKRDYIAFEGLFLALRVEEYIHYGTFNQLCERVINDDVNVRQFVENAIVSEYSSDSSNESKDDLLEDDSMDIETDSKKDESINNDGGQKRRKILIIDEVDVFFSKEFYGNSYTPAATIRDECIKEITDVIWQDHKQNGIKSRLKLKDIQKSEAYKHCKNKFRKFWMDLINEAIKQMLVDVKDFASTDYEVYKGKIGYKDGDKISTSATLGYKTLFTYYFEKEKGNVNEKDWLDSIGIYVKCGSFSYAEIPIKFDVILGVTGTLKTLSKMEQSIMNEEYGLKRHTYIPSLFGDRKERFTFKKLMDIGLMEDATFYENLKEEINNRMNDSSLPRCVFVCFENKLSLMNFYHSKEYSGGFKHNTLIMTEDTDKDEKNTIIKKAPISGKILLLTKEFGRGTDFQVSDKTVKSNGGPHMIQTFLSLQRSEEVQIMGRTARQGGKGSYSMILNTKELKDEFNITQDEINNARDSGKVYELLDSKRMAKFEREYKENERFVKNEATKLHENSIKLLKAMKNNHINICKSILLDFNRGPSTFSKNTSKIVILFDATGSMGPLLQQLKNTINTMFDRVSTILKEANMDVKCFQLQFIAYRSYNAPIKLLLERSGWSSDVIELRNFLSSIRASYGIWEEAIEVALQHVNRLVSQYNDHVSTCILIGDAPPTPSAEDVMNWRIQYKPEKFNWNKYKDYEIATYYKNEIAKFVENDISLNCYYLDEWAKTEFEWMSKETGGKCEYLNVNDSESANILTDVIATSILNACDKDGGENNGQLVKAYQQKFIHRSS